MFRIIFFIFFFATSLFSETKKIYFYTTESNINNFKSLKISFDKYLKKFGDFEFQPFRDQKTFEKYLKDKDSIVILSSWHYKNIAKSYNLEAKLIAEKKGSVTDSQILVGYKNIPYRGVVASAYNKKYSKELLKELLSWKSKKLSILTVPKEIDALMSVGFRMSKFAIVSECSFNLLKEVNPYLAKNLKVYAKSEPKYRMIVAENKIRENSKEIMNIFKKMNLSHTGSTILGQLRVEKLKPISKTDLKKIKD
jgi:hypothetical protein